MPWLFRNMQTVENILVYSTMPLYRQQFSPKFSQKTAHISP